MRDDLEHEAAFGFAGAIVVDENVLVEIENGAPILHRCKAASAGNGDHVELGQRILDAKILFEIAQRLDARLHRVMRALGLATAHDDAEFDAVDIGGDAFEIAEAEEEQIARHRRRVLETRARHAIGEPRRTCDRHIADRHQIAWRGDGDGEHRTHVRLVPHWREAARVADLELRRQRTAGLAVLVVFDAEEAVGVVEDGAVIVDADGVTPGAQRAARRQCQRLRFIVDDRGDRLVVDDRARHFDIERVHHHAGQRAIAFDRDRSLAGEGGGFHVGGDRDVVAHRRRRVLEPSAVGGVLRRSWRESRRDEQCGNGERTEVHALLPPKEVL